MKKIQLCSIVSDIRIDKFLSEILFDFSRSHIAKLIQNGEIFVNEKKIKPSYSLKKEDIISINIIPPKKINLTPQPLNIDIIYEDEFLAIIDKPSGMVVHPAAGHYDNTLVNALLYHLKDLSGINSELRPGIVHRLDKDTSGLMIVAKNDIAHRELTTLFKKREIKKYYKALVYGKVYPVEDRISKPIGRHKYNRIKFSSNTNSGKIAITNYQVETYYSEFTLVDINIETGRTHQIRVHFSEKGYPLLGDELYGRKKINEKFKLGRLFLHSYRLAFFHPVTNEYLDIKIKLPEELENFLKTLEKSSGN